jgi:3'(2'), 5'-bisphosphate nucleotidase
MMENKDYNELFIKLAAISTAAGAEIMKIYSGDFNFRLKEDDSPLTAADEVSHLIISDALQPLLFNGEVLPVLSEEGCTVPYETRKDWVSYWLIDPLDGTKEFISRNGEFTVNIALIRGNKPHLGMVYLPVQNLLYYGGACFGSFKTSGSDIFLEQAVRLPIKIEREPNVLYAAGSRSHRTAEFDGWVEDAAKKRNCSRVEVITAGSSLKFCLAAEGTVDIFPRFGPTMEWDTAAAHAVVEGAGKSCIKPDGGSIVYNKPVMKNNGFIVL